jgi:HEPN domain-containing protein
MAASDLEGLRILAEKEVAYALCRSKLAEILEKTLKAELLRLGWFLEKTHDLEKLAGELRARNSDLTDKLRPLCNQLAEVYFSARYPGFDLEDSDWPAFRTQLDQITELHQAVKARLAPMGNPGS